MSLSPCPSRYPVRPFRTRYGALRHVLHAAGDDHVVRSDEDVVVAEHRRLHRRAAHLGQRRGADVPWHASVVRRLARRRLLQTRHQAAAHDHLADIVRRDLGAIERRLDRRSAQVRRRDVLEVAQHATHRRPRSANDHDRIRLFGHFTLLNPLLTTVARPEERCRARRRRRSSRADLRALSLEHAAYARPAGFRCRPDSDRKA